MHVKVKKLMLMGALASMPTLSIFSVASGVTPLVSGPSQVVWSGPHPPTPINGTATEQPTYEINVQTGVVTYEGITSQPDVASDITGPNNPCNAGDFCLIEYEVPCSDLGFSGLGTANGTWVCKGEVQTNNWKGYFEWYPAGEPSDSHYSPQLGTDDTVYLTGEATIEQVVINGS
jgi:hypothetical protein